MLLLLLSGSFSFLFQTSDILYYEVLDIPLPELQGLKTLKIAFHHATKDEVSHINTNDFHIYLPFPAVLS